MCVFLCDTQMSAVSAVSDQTRQSLKVIQRLTKHGSAGATNRSSEASAPRRVSVCVWESQMSDQTQQFLDVLE